VFKEFIVFALNRHFFCVPIMKKNCKILQVFKKVLKLCELARSLCLVFKILHPFRTVKIPSLHFL